MSFSSKSPREFEIPQRRRSSRSFPQTPTYFFHLIEAPNSRAFVRRKQEHLCAACWTSARYLKMNSEERRVCRWKFLRARRLERKKKQPKSVWRHRGNFDSAEDLLKRGAMLLSVPHTRYHGDGEDAFSGETWRGERSRKIAERKGGRFHIKVISTLKKRSWRLKMFCHGCEGMHGIARRDLFFFFSASLLWYLPRWWGGMGTFFFLCPPLASFDGRPGTSGAVQKRTILGREAAHSRIRASARL